MSQVCPLPGIFSLLARAEAVLPSFQYDCVSHATGPGKKNIISQHQREMKRAAQRREREKWWRGVPYPKHNKRDQRG